MFKHAQGPFAGRWEIEGRLVMSSTKAWLIEMLDGRREWFPQRGNALIEGEDGRVVVLVADWLVREKKLA